VVDPPCVPGTWYLVVDTVWPMAVGFFAKLALGGLESFLLTKGVAQLGIRRICNTTAAVVSK
jgi:hypothetical protein